MFTVFKGWSGRFAGMVADCAPAEIPLSVADAMCFDPLEKLNETIILLDTGGTFDDVTAKTHYRRHFGETSNDAAPHD